MSSQERSGEFRTIQERSGECRTIQERAGETGGYKESPREIRSGPFRQEEVIREQKSYMDKSRQEVM